MSKKNSLKTEERSDINIKKIVKVLIIDLFFNFLDWQFYRETLLDLVSESEFNEKKLKLVQNKLIFKEEYQSDSIFEKFSEVINKQGFSGDWIDKLKSRIKEAEINDGYIDFETDKQITSYSAKMDRVTEIFNRFTYSEVRPFIKNELLEDLINVPIDFQKIIKKIQVYKGMTLTILFENFFKDIENNKVYWRTQNRINVPINNK